VGLVDQIRQQTFTLDALGNVTGLTQSYQNDPSRSQPFQSKYNAENVSTKPGNAANANGDLTRVTDFQAQRTNRFDAWNRLVGSTLTNITGGGRIIYRYDALGREIREVSSTAPSGLPLELYDSLSGQVLEEASSVGIGRVRAYRDNIWSQAYINALAMVADRSALTGEKRYYPLQDANFNVTALVVAVRAPGG